MANLLAFLGSRAGRWAGIGLAGAALLGSFVTLYRTFAESDAVASSKNRLFICAETGKSFRHAVSPGEVTPVRSPHSGENTGYPAELCYWTAGGAVKEEPTAVLLHAYLGREGPTFCPDCNRLVVGHNPRPAAGAAPPPLEDQFRPSKKDRQDER